MDWKALEDAYGCDEYAHKDCMSKGDPCLYEELCFCCEQPLNFEESYYEGSCGEYSFKDSFEGIF